MRILCCEDEEEVLQIYKHALEEQHHKVIATLDSDECLTIYKQVLDNIQNDNSSYDKFMIHPFDVVVLDYKMPKKNGLEIAKEMFALVPNQRIIFASANVRETVESSLRGLKQVVEVLKKPFDVSQLIETIESVEKHNAFRSLLENIVEKPYEDDASYQDTCELSDEQVKRILSGVNRIYKI
jgi:two-component system cell cycle response regulator CpdR